MKAVPMQGQPTVLVEVDTEEKMSTIIDGPDGPVEFFMYSTANPDGRRAQPTTGTVISSVDNDIPEGSYLLFHHNACAHTQMVSEEIIGSDLIKMKQPSHKQIYRINRNLCFAYLSPGNTDFVPLYPFCIAQRVFKEPEVTASGIILNAEREQVKNMATIKTLPKSGDVYGLKEGDQVYIHEKSDYEMVCKIAGRMTYLIRLNINWDIIGVAI